MSGAKYGTILAIAGLAIGVPGAAITVLNYLAQDEPRPSELPFIEATVHSIEDDVGFEKGVVLDIENTGGKWSELFIDVRTFIILGDDELYLIREDGGSWLENDNLGRNRRVITVEFDPGSNRRYQAFSDEMGTTSRVVRFHLAKIRYADLRGDKSSVYISFAPGQYKKVDSELGDELMRHGGGYCLYTGDMTLSEEIFSGCRWENDFPL